MYGMGRKLRWQIAVVYHKIMNLLLWEPELLTVEVMMEQAIGHANKIPTMLFFSGIARDTQSKSYILNVSGNSKTMFCGILINMTY